MAELNRFQKLVAEAKKNVAEISPNESSQRLENGEAIVIDVREEDSWREEHIAGAKHLGRGIIELEIEEQSRISINRSSAIAAAGVALRS